MANPLKQFDEWVELVDIIDDADARSDIDSFTTQPARRVLVRVTEG